MNDLNNFDAYIKGKVEEILILKRHIQMLEGEKCQLEGNIRSAKHELENISNDFGEELYRLHLEDGVVFPMDYGNFKVSSKLNHKTKIKVENEQEIPEMYKKEQIITKLDKQMMKKDLKAGLNVPGVGYEDDYYTVNIKVTAESMADI
jgi:hypothetical protein